MNKRQQTNGDSILTNKQSNPKKSDTATAAVQRWNIERGDKEIALEFFLWSIAYKNGDKTNRNINFDAIPVFDADGDLPVIHLDIY